MSTPRFFSTPFRYLRWASRERPAIFWSIFIGSLGPPMIVIVPPIRHYFGDLPREPVPMTYPSKLESRGLWVYGEITPIPKPAAVKEACQRDGDGGLLIAVAVPKGPRKIPEGYDDP
jgi:hypothetical protein